MKQIEMTLDIVPEDTNDKILNMGIIKEVHKRSIVVSTCKNSNTQLKKFKNKEIIGRNRSLSRTSELLLKVNGSNEQEYYTTIDSIMIKIPIPENSGSSINWLKPQLDALKSLISEEFYIIKNYPSASRT